MTESMFEETPVIKKIVTVSLAATQPKILHVEAETEIGPLVLRLSEIAAVELTAHLGRFPLTRGSSS